MNVSLTPELEKLVTRKVEIVRVLHGARDGRAILGGNATDSITVA
jgi:hypothetical protein